MNDQVTHPSFMTRPPLPYDHDAGVVGPAVLADIGAPPFPYVGQALDLAEFQDYVRAYHFGSIPPDYVVLHHTSVPDASWAAASIDPSTRWDSGEQGLTDAQIKAHRLRKLANIRDYYNHSLGWDAGPHLFVDDRWIYLFSPMNNPGIHAKWGNAFHTPDGRLHYSVGIEVIGHYANVRWPDAVALNVGCAVVMLQHQLNTFQLDYLYADPALRPGVLLCSGVETCAHPERLRFGGLSSHRDYNKPACPGAAITEAFYLNAIRTAASRMQQAPPTPVCLTTYRVKDPCDADNPSNNFAAVRTAPDIHAPLALAGNARLNPGETFLADAIVGEWVHIAKADPRHDLGFVSIHLVEVVKAA